MLNSIQKKTGAILLIFLVVIIGINLKTFLTTESQASDGVVINLAGKQRMLTQKMTKEALSVTQELMNQSELIKTVNLFDKTLKGLISGDKSLNLPPCKSDHIVNQLERVQGLWTPFRAKIQNVIDNHTDTQSLDYILANNIKLLQEMNKAVKMFEEESSSKVSTLQVWQIVFIGFAITLFIFAINLMSRWIINPVLDIEKAAQLVADGNTDVQVDIKTDDELGKLAESFNTMVSNIMQAQCDLIKEKESVEERIKIAIEESEKQNKYLSEKTEEMLGAMDRLATGDLTVKIVPEKDDLIGQIFNGFNRVVTNIKTMITEVQSAVEATASAASQISASTSTIAAGAQEQSSQASEVADAVMSIAGTVVQTNNSADEAKGVSLKAGEIAKLGGNIVNDTVSSMNKIAGVVSDSAEIVKGLGENSDKIGDIVVVIEDIADQTNLLALNAAIEAARAGEQGRGFAVVADEVRNLADRTTSATKEIETIISQIQNDTSAAVDSMKIGTSTVSEGKAKANEAGDSLSEIISGTENVVSIVSNVAESSEQQAAAIEQVSSNMEGIKIVANDTAANVEQIAMAADELTNLTNQLTETSQRFKIENYEIARY
ncbi:MAG: methyl-accepting chemotaxis protein [Rhodothermaceae bacterium]